MKATNGILMRMMQFENAANVTHDENLSFDDAYYAEVPGKELHEVIISSKIMFFI